MFSVSPAEILTIAVVALIVFGPKRLPDATRRAGKIIREMRDTAQELRDGIEREAATADKNDDLDGVRRRLTTPPADDAGQP